MEDQIVHAIITVDDARLAFWREVAGEPFDEAVHRRLRLSFRSLVLPTPAPDLARHVVARPAELVEPDGDVIDRMQRCNDAVHRVKHRPTFGGGKAREALVPKCDRRETPLCKRC